ncbi:hypothetical protein PPMP20_14390 [Paraburkholderia phymatum]|uniref:hypothetical protein n=1 Tax=Paraburkholderia phymatum TaxID=148447 RepID=UPI0012FDAB9A|nr:hypothetical protein [Paraburkholderia phymatum]
MANGLAHESFSVVLRGAKAMSFRRVYRERRDPPGHGVLHGELMIRTGAIERLYNTGDVFHPQADKSHSERFGPGGVQKQVGRK